MWPFQTVTMTVPEGLTHYQLYRETSTDGVAVLLKSGATLESDLDIRQCRRYVENVNLARVSLPHLCKHEIARLRK
jgi:hypothetical protein